MNLSQPQILFEDNHLLIINKSSGELVQGDKTGDITSIDKVKEYLKIKYNKKGRVFIGLINRIDRPTSGIVMFAKTSKALSRMNDKLRDRDIKKKYWLIISKGFKSIEGELKGWFRKNEKQNKSYYFSEEVKNSKFGLLKYQKLKDFDNYSLIEVDLITGRHHQIRCNFSKIGFPILGDLKYGSKRSNKDGGIYLHSKSIEFNHPVTKKVILINADPPMKGLWTVSLFD